MSESPVDKRPRWQDALKDELVAVDMDKYKEFAEMAAGLWETPEFQEAIHLVAKRIQERVDASFLKELAATVPPDAPV